MLVIRSRMNPTAIWPIFTPVTKQYDQVARHPQGQGQASAAGAGGHGPAQRAGRAIVCKVGALQAFVRDLGQRLKQQADASGATVVTPLELKKCVLESADLSFLHAKVASIDETDAKYHKPTRKRAAPRKREATDEATPSKPGRKKAKTTAAKARGSEAPPLKPAVEATPAAAAAIQIEEDDNYDSSESEEE
ncbi:hypothetical protein Poli38472_009980 [Pythium oligandrum]|uniref:Uncharacterized protein n=1 Tax=Pythium oligandrum TaxID=41045 RepID=A0A8K1C8L8_PYTOL|nr:hypothetical protein Poli38472_009980 [Pythium oligandrum]|eukprot:TMW58421.1 hypothetical protein Poli38472_009980 [Pythium oligandrum]